MRVQSLLVAALGMCLFASSANAAFELTTTRATSTVNANWDVIKILAKNLGGDSGTKLQAFAVEMSVLDTTKNLILHTPDLDSDGANDLNLNGSGTFAIANPPGSYARVGAATAWTTIDARVNGTQVYAYQVFDDTLSDKDADGIPDFDPLARFANPKSVRVEGLPGTPPTASVNPVQFAAVVVPKGTPVRFAGNIGGDVGVKQNFSIDDPIPEPASMSLLALGAMAFLGRRSRKA